MTTVWLLFQRNSDVDYPWSSAGLTTMINKPLLHISVGTTRKTRDGRKKRESYRLLSRITA